MNVVKCAAQRDHSQFRHFYQPQPRNERSKARKGKKTFKNMPINK